MVIYGHCIWVMLRHSTFLISCWDICELTRCLMRAHNIFMILCELLTYVPTGANRYPPLCRCLLEDTQNAQILWSLTYSTYPTNLYTPKSRPRNHKSIQPPHPQWYPQKPDQPPPSLLNTNRYHLHNQQSFPLHNIVDVVPTKTKR